MEHMDLIQIVFFLGLYFDGHGLSFDLFAIMDNLSFKFSGEHNSSPLYTTRYNQKNLNSIRHLLSQQINSLGLWETDLRNYIPKNINVHNHKHQNQGKV
jgi:hypothetical protein